MTDLSTTIAPKSDQLNADDLIGVRTMNITITKVTKSDTPDQPISIHFDGDNGKPYKPCKSMRRVLVHIWGADGNQYIGRSLTIYRDESVKFGGADVGGIRISHMSDMPNNKPVTLALTASKANRKPYTVRPLAIETPDPVFPILSPDGKECAVKLSAWVAAYEKGYRKGGQEFFTSNMPNVTAICAQHPDLEAQINGAIQRVDASKNPLIAG